MNRTAKWLLLSALGLVLAVGASSCNKKADQTATSTETTTPSTTTEPVQVVAVDLGKNIGEDKQVTEKIETFKPGDTIYASIHTSGGSPESKLGVKWTFQDGQVVDQSEQAIAPNGAAATEFHISKPDGLPPGNYKVEVFVDGSPVQSREFKVTAG
jgi:hypothetical protein